MLTLISCYGKFQNIYDNLFNFQKCLALHDFILYNKNYKKMIQEYIDKADEANKANSDFNINYNAYNFIHSKGIGDDNNIYIFDTKLHNNGFREINVFKSGREEIIKTCLNIYDIIPYYTRKYMKYK